ncbi:unnamed protein product [Dovyalis caffra]|uniref:Uncharacterized protein n=1 Tax=Dovyalis caffra TaxID=77055 RepID=A0AAV1RZI1_9ROSI|nr:unnamed protein product [Dovyalis caffra]
MAGIMHKIEETLHMGGKKEEQKGETHSEQKGETHGEHKGEYKPEHGKGEQKEGFVDKIKEKIHGDGAHGEGEKKKKEKKEKKKKGEHGHDGHSSSSDNKYVVKMLHEERDDDSRMEDILRHPFPSHFHRLI